MNFNYLPWRRKSEKPDFYRGGGGGGAHEKPIYRGEVPKKGVLAVCRFMRGWLGLGQEGDCLRERGGNCLKYLKIGWNRIEGRERKDLQMGSPAGSRGHQICTVDVLSSMLRKSGQKGHIFVMRPQCTP